MNRLKVLTLNIWNRQGPWEARLALIREGIEALSPDIVGLQEVLSHEGRSQADEIAEGLGYHAAYGEAHDLGGGVLFGNAALSRWPIEKQQVFPLPALHSGEDRSMLLAEIASPHGLIPLFVTHLSWKFHHGVVREAQVAEIADRLMEATPMEGLPPILVGDLNAQPDAAEIRFLTGLQSLGGKSIYLADAFGQVGEGRGVTFDDKNPHAADLREPPRRIDYILVRGPDKKGRGKPLSAKVVLDAIRDGVCASDHYGVYAELSL